MLFGCSTGQNSPVVWTTAEHVVITFIIWYMISFFQSLPESIEESARIDGCSEGQMFRMIVLPLVAPGIAAVGMLSFLYAWNEYTYSVMFVQQAV